jgi:hypothetical protein
MHKNELYRCFYTLFFALFLSGCTSKQSLPLPFDAWSVIFFSPDYMDVWIETAMAVDTDNQVIDHVGGGIPAQGYPRAMSKGAPANFRGKPAGWPENPGGKGRRVLNANLPKLIYIRWQSIAEPQTYEVAIEIPDSTRELMRKREDIFCPFDGKVITDYRKLVVVGLAPGGIAKVWIKGPCLRAIEVTRVQARIFPLRPYIGSSGAKYHPLEEESKAYIKKFGIPYDSW